MIRIMKRTESYYKEKDRLILPKYYAENPNSLTHEL